MIKFNTISFYIELKKLKSIADRIVGITKFFLLKINTKIHKTKTNILINKSLSASTPAGKIIILPSKAAKVEYATQLNHSNTFDFTLTFSDVSAPINLEIKVAKDVATIASIII